MWDAAFLDIVTRDVALSGLTSVRIGGRGAWVATPRTEQDVVALLNRFRSEGIEPWILGGGTNVLMPDEGLEAPVVLAAELRTLEIDGAGLVSAGAGIGTAHLVAKTAGLGLAGLHVLAGVPGQIGGAAAMNAGTKHGEIVESIEALDVVTRQGERRRYRPRDLDYGYRRSGLAGGDMITRVHLRLVPAESKAGLRKLLAAWLKDKQESQPVKSWNFGCMFKNPPGDAAGRLVDRAGLKGRRIGNAAISARHGNFIENLGGATAADVLALMALCEERVAEAFGVQLEREVRVFQPPVCSPG